MSWSFGLQRGYKGSKEYHCVSEEKGREEFHSILYQGRVKTIGGYRNFFHKWLKSWSVLNSGLFALKTLCCVEEKEEGFYFSALPWFKWFHQEKGLTRTKWYSWVSNRLVTVRADQVEDCPVSFNNLEWNWNNTKTQKQHKTAVCVVFEWVYLSCVCVFLFRCMLFIHRTFIFRVMEYSLDGHNASLSAIRTVRVLRPLRAINRVPSKTKRFTELSVALLAQ